MKILIPSRIAHQFRQLMKISPFDQNHIQHKINPNIITFKYTELICTNQTN